MNYAASTSTKGGAAYLGKDILGSVRSVSGDYGMLEDRYEYDAFGKPYAGDLSSGMSLGYTGKPYDTATGMYDYGYRDYKPENARFTTVDPVRDGANWFAYVNNDPVNYFDPFGLTASEPKISFSSSLFVPTIKTEVNLFEKAIPTPVFNSGVIVPTEIVPAYFLQNDWSTVLGQTFANNSCAATTIMNEVSKDYTQKTGTSLSWFEGNVAMKAAVDSPNINNGKSEAPAYVNNWTNAANTMWQDTGQTGNLPNAGTHTVYAVNTDKDPEVDHFVNSNGNGTYRDPLNGNTRTSINPPTQGGQTRNF
jgi:RHS repeat-associated protein